MSHELTFKQWHHGYLGVILTAIGIWRGWTWLVFIGGYVTVDDILQHFIQWKWDDSYQSPLKFFYAKWIWEPLHRDDA